MRTMLLFPLVAFLPGMAVAQSAEALSAADRTAHRHLGFLLRMDLGAAYMSNFASQEGLSASLAGAGAAAGIVMGAAVSEDWILGGDIWGVSAFSPTASAGGQSAASHQTLTLSGLGLNLTHYFMPDNFYISFSPSLVLLYATNQNEGLAGETSPGFGARLLIGKEWWVSDHWGLGLAGEAFFGANKEKGGGPTWFSVGGGLVFSATYN